MKTHGFYEKQSYDGSTEAVVFRTKIPNAVAALAMQLLERWGMVAGETDGEDSAGRQKLRLATPEEMAVRACRTAELAWQEFERRGWITDLPEAKPPTRPSDD